MIQLQNISLAFGGHRVFEGLTWSIAPQGQRLGLIGPNGAGKTTLLRVIDGRQPVDEGSVQRGRTSVGYLEQTVQEMPGDRSVRGEALRAFDDVLELEAEEQRITQALSDATDYESDDYQKLLDRLGQVQERLNTREAHRIRPQVEATLTGLGFDPDDLDRPLSTFSGGWRMRVALAKLLLTRPDVLLLDEPTNHLDIDSIDWLESYLKGYPGTVIIVSHDRYFLDRMVNGIVEMAQGRVEHYDGNYSYYLEAREERRALQQAAYENQQRKIKEIEQFIDRFRYNASKASQVQSRIKQLEKMERIPPPPSEEATITFRFPEPHRSGRVVMELSSFSKTYATDEGTVRVFDDADPLTIERGDKIALAGPNGAGKSTLARILRGTEPFDGTRTEGHNVDMAFFAQHQADTLDPGETILESVRQVDPRKSDTDLRNLLGTFLFTGDDVFKKVRVLSGGEKSRVALARTLLTPANFLILDEPTNHLDIQSKSVLIDALQQYEGTFVVVSHDRHFLDEVVEKVWRVGGGRVATFFGNYSDYRWQVEHGSAQALQHETANGSSTNGAPKKSSGATASNGTATQAVDKNGTANGSTSAVDDARFADLNTYQLKRKLDETETTIVEKEEQQADLETAMSDPGLYDDPDEARETTEAYQRTQQDLARLYDDWEILTELVMAHENA